MAGFFKPWIQKEVDSNIIYYDFNKILYILATKSFAPAAYMIGLIQVKETAV